MDHQTKPAQHKYTAILPANVRSNTLRAPGLNRTDESARRKKWLTCMLAPAKAATNRGPRSLV